MFFISKLKVPHIRTIYNNYDLWEYYEESAKESCIENGIELTDNNIWDEIYLMDSDCWDNEKLQLIEFFTGGHWILQGKTELWTGRHKGGYIFTEFMDMFYKATQDCEYINIYDINGHFFIKCSHHDGTNFYEIKKLTESGINYFNNWSGNYDDKRTEEYIHEKIMSRYSILPNYMYNVYGCNKVEFKTE